MTDDLFLDHYLKRIDPSIATTFTEPQCEALKVMLGCRGAGRHLVDLRPTVTFGRRRYYLALMFGRDRRVLTRVANIGLLERLRGLLGFLGLAVLLLTPLFALAYLIRELVDVEIQTSALFGLLSGLVL